MTQPPTITEQSVPRFPRGADAPQAAQLTKARDDAAAAVATAQRNGSADPLGTFTQLTKADAELDDGSTDPTG